VRTPRRPLSLPVGRPTLPLLATRSTRSPLITAMRALAA